MRTQWTIHPLMFQKIPIGLGCGVSGRTQMSLSRFQTVGLQFNGGGVVFQLPYIPDRYWPDHFGRLIHSAMILSGDPLPVTIYQSCPRQFRASVPFRKVVSLSAKDETGSNLILSRPYNVSSVQSVTICSFENQPHHQLLKLSGMKMVTRMREKRGKKIVMTRMWAKIR